MQPSILGKRDRVQAPVPDHEEPALKRPKVEPEIVTGLPKNKEIVSLIRLMIEEFNCNHQADQDQTSLRIFSREKEEESIMKFIKGNWTASKSGLLYLCGHPGTGKTSTLNMVFDKLREDE